jgi:hypothetical protein
LDRLARMRGVVVGIDLSTLRAAACVISPPHDQDVPVMSWSTVTLPQHDHLSYRQVLAVDVMSDWLRKIEANSDMPARIGLEVPLAGPRTPIVSFLMIGALHVSIGEVWGSRVPVNAWGSGQWKLRATGSGYRPGHIAGKPTKAAKRKAEKARIGLWAREVCGYTGSMEDEQDATGVAVAEALLWMNR